MVQLKYFGDDRDYFKYDLITHLLCTAGFLRYVFIPMLTKHWDDSEGQIKPKESPGRSSELLSFIQSCARKDLAHWQTWLASRVDCYQTVQPVNSMWFRDDVRQEYWRAYEPFAAEDSSLVFIDPDTGLQTGTPGYRRKMGPEKYLLDYELKSLFESAGRRSAFMIYQHLQRNSTRHDQDVRKKIEQARNATGSEHVLAYREEDLAFIFVLTDDSISHTLGASLREYDARSSNSRRAIYLD